MTKTIHDETLPDESNLPLLLDRLALHAKNSPNKLALTFLGSSGPNGMNAEQQYTYEQIDQHTTNLASKLLNIRGLSKGDRVVLVYPPSLDFFIAFLACLKAGIVAVPVFPPNPARRDSLDMFSKIVSGCGAKCALTSEKYQHMKKLAGIKDTLTKLNRSSSASSWPDLEWIVTDSASAAAKSKASSTVQFPTIDKSDLAFLQYTSGSTSDPKGVMITHGNLAHNLHIITRELQASSQDTIVVSWLPQYHDMGLIGSYLGVIHCGGSGYYMSPLTFLQRPMIWMEAVSKYKATHMQAPNFAFKLTARKFVPGNYEGQPLQLASVRHVINGAEPVDEDSIQAFCNAFSPYGLKREVIFPTYGLAEHTVFVCSGGTQILTVDKSMLEVDGVVMEVKEGDTSSDTVRKVVGCGYPCRQNVDVRIVHPETCEQLKDDHVGEIWVNSPSKAVGYFNKPVESKAEFRAQLASAATDSVTEKNDDLTTTGYLSSGDLGFMHNDELFICGRLKDLIIVAGRNHYPQDIEATAETTSDLLRPGCCAAFSVDPNSEDSEEVALIFELRDVPPKQELETVCENIIQKIQASIKREHALGISHFVLLKPRTIPKTTSGKIARSWCRKAFLAKTLQSVYTKDFKEIVTPQVDGVDTSEGIGPLEIDSSKARGTVNTVNAPEIRELSLNEILKRLKSDIGKMGQLQADSIDANAPLITLMDSLSISQLKGMLESEYATKVSDEYLFRESTTTSKLVEVVKLGFAPDDSTDDGSTEQHGGAKITSPGAVGQVGGLAGALGCPPGVVCCTIL